MSIKVGINGFGRIGRMVLRCSLNHPEIEIVGINDLCPADYLAYMVKYDTMHGKFNGDIYAEGNNIVVNGKAIPVSAERDPAMHARCLACTEEAARRAASRGGVFIYRCWRGLMSACAPILLDGQSPGRLVLSGFVSTPDSMAAAEQLFPDPDFQLSPDELATFPFIYQTRVRDTMRIVSIAASATRSRLLICQSV